MLLTSILKKNAQNFSNSPALTMRMGYRTITLTYSDVYQMAKKVALFLQDQGINKEDKVLICAPNSPYWITVFWGCLLRGSIIVPLNLQSTHEIIQGISEQTEARIIFTHQFFKHKISDIIKEFRLEFLPELLEMYDSTDFISADINEQNIVEIMYTSGTTGKPKGVVLTHKNIASNFMALTQIIKIKHSNDRLLSVLPLSHILEQTIGFLLPYYFGSNIIYAHSHSAIHILMREFSITKIVAVPEFLQVIMMRIQENATEQKQLERFKKALHFSSWIGFRWFSRLLFYKIHKKFGGKLDTFAVGGASLDPALEKKWRALGLHILQGYGLTETSPIITLSTFKEHRHNSVGKVLPIIQVRLADDGEIQVKGPSVFSGYYNDLESTKDAFTDNGWFKTGDIGQFDQDGYLFLRGRKKYMILRSDGQNVFPGDIEIVLNKHDAVKSSCIIGLEKGDSHLQIHAVLLLHESDEKQNEVAQQVIASVNNQLASYQHIGGFTLWQDDDFPRTASRKIKKDVVRNQLKKQEKKEKIQATCKTTKLIKLLSNIASIEPAEITPESKIISELGFDSLMRVELMAHLEENFGVHIDESCIVSTTTVAQLEKTLETQKSIKPRVPLSTWPRKWWARLTRSFFQFFVFFLMRFWIKLHIQGKENLEKLPMPAIFMPNHISYLDSLVVTMALPYRVRNYISFAAAHDVVYEEYAKFATIVEFLFNVFSFPRRESENVKVGLENIGFMLDNGFSVVVYPEGKISLDGILGQLKHGAGLIASQMDAWIVPIKITGTNKIAKFGTLIPIKRGFVTVKFGTPIKFKRSDNYQQVTKKLEAIIREM